MQVVDIPLMRLVGRTVRGDYAALRRLIPATFDELRVRLPDLDRALPERLWDISLGVEDGIYTRFVGARVSDQAATPEGLERLTLSPRAALHRVHNGPATGVSRAFGDMKRWARERGHAPDGQILWEVHPTEGNGPIELYVSLEFARRGATA